MTQMNPERSSDLEWMLTSSQEDERAFVKFLILDQYAQIYQLCEQALDDPASARQATNQTLASATLRAHQFTGHTSAPAWIYHQAIEICQHRYYTELPLSRLIRLLHNEIDLSIGDIAYVLKISERRVRSELSRPESLSAVNQRSAVLDLSAGMDSAGYRQIEQEVLLLVQLSRQRRRFSARLQEAALVGLGLLLAIGLGWVAFASIPLQANPTPPLQPALVTIQEVLVYPSNPSLPGMLPERRIIFSAEAGDTLISIAKKAAVSLDILQELNQIPPEKPLQPGQPIVIAMETPALSQITPTPVTPVPPGESISLFSNENEIRARILESQHNWNTLWAEADTIFYGPAGYVGPPRIEHQQVWISQPGYSLTLSGGPDGEVKTAIQASAGLVTSLDFQTGARTSLNRDILVNYTQPVHELLLPTRMRTPFRGVIEVVGEEIISSRPTLLVDLSEFDPNSSYSLAGEPIHTGRFWVDRATGVILRRQWFDPGMPGLLVQEVVVTRIKYDLPLSNRFFDPFQPLPTRLYWYANRNPLIEVSHLHISEPVARHGRNPWPKRKPPEDLDLARSSLDFQWTSLAELDPSQPTRADVFADGYYLGNVLFGDPLSLSCLRSPDGNRIAFTEWFEEPPFGAGPLRWFSLDRLHTVYEPMPDLISGNFIFSADSRKLSLFACTRALLGCGIYILDLASGDYQQLVEMSYAGSLAWSPDGEQLAFKGAKKPREQSSLWILNVGNGAITYNGPLDPKSGQPEADAPVLSWGVPFQEAARGLESCSQPQPIQPDQ